MKNEESTETNRRNLDLGVDELITDIFEEEPDFLGVSQHSHNAETRDGEIEAVQINHKLCGAEQEEAEEEIDFIKEGSTNIMEEKVGFGSVNVLNLKSANPIKKDNHIVSLKKIPPITEKKCSSRNVLKKYNGSYFNSDVEKPVTEAYSRYSRKSNTKIVNISKIQNFPSHKNSNITQKFSELKFSDQSDGQPPSTSHTKGKEIESTDENNVEFRSLYKNLKEQPSDEDQARMNKIESNQTPLGSGIVQSESRKSGNQQTHDIAMPFSEILTRNIENDCNNQTKTTKPVNFSENIKIKSKPRFQSLKKNDISGNRGELNLLTCEEIMGDSSLSMKDGNNKHHLTKPNISKPSHIDTHTINQPTRPASFRKTEPTPKFEFNYTLEKTKLSLSSRLTQQQSKADGVPLVPCIPNHIREVPLEASSLSNWPKTTKSCSKIMQTHSLSDAQMKIEKIFSMNTKKIDPRSCFMKESRNDNAKTSNRLLEQKHADCCRCEDKNNPHTSHKVVPELFKSRLTDAYRQSANSIVAEYIKNPDIMKKYSDKKENVYNDDYKNLLFEKKHTNDLKMKHNKLKFLVEKEAADAIKKERGNQSAVFDYNKDYVV